MIGWGFQMIGYKQMIGLAATHPFYARPLWRVLPPSVPLPNFCLRSRPLLTMLINQIMLRKIIERTGNCVEIGTKQNCKQVNNLPAHQIYCITTCHFCGEEPGRDSQEKVVPANLGILLLITNKKKYKRVQSYCLVLILSFGFLLLILYHFQSYHIGIYRR